MEENLNCILSVGVHILKYHLVTYLGTNVVYSFRLIRI